MPVRPVEDQIQALVTVVRAQDTQLILQGMTRGQVADVV